jgi:hypothetical protein
MKTKWKKKHVGKVKVGLSTSSILKKNPPKIILEKKHWGKYRSKTKIIRGNIITTHNVLKKKTTKQNRQRPFWKKKRKKFIKKLCSETL